MKRSLLDMVDKIEGKYDPLSFENEIYGFWQKNNYFHAEPDQSKTPFSMVIPPPNVTGYLHVGHALNNTLQDVVIRYRRMKGFNTAWIPGTDHAGIATQNVVEKSLAEKGTDRHSLGREKFVEEVWKWKDEYGSRIISQLKALGCSCDWDRQRFTFDDDYVNSVTTEFISLYNEGLIYRGNYMTNWCPRCRTAISDIEVEHQDKKGNLWDIKYPLIDPASGKPSSEEYIIVSTTRPETMLGDTAVAVNPGDSRYKKLKGRLIFLPLMERIIPIVEDDYVDKDFGSGAVKVTPAHDPNDFEIGRRHDLEEINIMDEDAVLNSNAGRYAGMDRYEARKKVLADLKSGGYYLSKKEHTSSTGICSRCDTIVEPRVSMQWFVAMKKLAAPAIEAVREGRVKIVPGKWENIYFEWMENIRDWCISRQLWWGHRIPVWYCGGCGEMIVIAGKPEKCSKCGGADLSQDEDVLDTWFSSCLWPFATLGWPEKTKDLEHFFPTDVLITAHDIIFFGVARMIVMALHFMDHVPFKQVFINPLVNDSTGKKMSKSKGNVVDPMVIIDKNGADVLRFTLTSLTTPGKNLLLGDEKIEGTRNFANKIWNASRFVISAIEENGQDSTGTRYGDIDLEVNNISEMDLDLWDKWIISRLNSTILDVEKNLLKFNFSTASRSLYNFFWSEFCDWYLESSKVRLYNSSDDRDKEVCQFVLWFVLEKYLKTMHPFMPHITERIWQAIPHKGKSIMVEEYPVADKTYIDKEAENTISPVFDIISEVRKIRSELKINPGSKVSICLDIKEDDISKSVSGNTKYIQSLARVDKIELRDAGERKGYIKTTIGSTDIYIYILDAVDIDLEIKRISDEMVKIEAGVAGSRKKLENPQFIEKAPEEIIIKEKNKLKQAGQINAVLTEQLDKMKNIKK
ncbi:MAG: valine--tRNA ligase [Candidatus Humimicrobiaceae bacterium]